MKTKKLTKKELLVISKTEIREELKQLFENEGSTVYTENLHTSQSGMMRSIKVYTEKMTDITDLVAELCDYKFHKTGGLKVEGCGMDMGFHVVYYLSVNIYCVDGYDHDLAYTLKHRWL